MKALNQQSEILAVAQAVASKHPGADVKVHNGDHGHRAIQLSGAIYPEEARAICNEIAGAIRSLTVQRDGSYPDVKTGAGYALVWWR